MTDSLRLSTRLKKKEATKEGIKEKDEDGLPPIPNEDLDEYLDFYERLMKKRLKVDIEKLREKMIKKITHTMSKKNNSREDKTIQERVEEAKVFYEGDIVKMDRMQFDKEDDSSKAVRWYNWDMVMVLANPDHPEFSEDNVYLDDADEAKYIYKKCFKEVYRENQTEMKHERKLELDMIKALAEDHLIKEDGVLNRGGGRFAVNEIEKRTETMANGGQNNINASEANLETNTIENDEEAFLDTRIYLSDFSTLVLNAIIYRLNKILGFETLLLLSK